MEHYLHPDIVSHILPYLNKKSSFNFLNTTKLLSPCRKFLYGKYVFNKAKIMDHGIIKYVKILECVNINNIINYKNLISLTINNKIFNNRIDNLPAKLESLTIISDKFNRPLDNLPKSLIYLKINGKSFEQSLNKLPTTLKTLKIYFCDGYEYDEESKLNDLPDGLRVLQLDNYDFSIMPNKFSSGLRELVLKNCHDINQLYGHWPLSLEKIDY